MLEVLVVSPREVLFHGQARRVIVPGEQGVMEVLPFHRPLLSRLLPGVVVVDEALIPIHRGVVKVAHDHVTVIVEQDLPVVSSSTTPPASSA